MTLLQYEVFHAVVETKSFTKAGELLGLTQSAISHAIKGLEADLDTPLLIRGRSGISLTSGGNQMLPYIRKILNLSEQMKQEAAAINNVEIGTLRIGSFSSVTQNMLPSILKRFKDRHPRIEIKLFEGDYDEIKIWLSQGMIDIGFSTLPIDKSFDYVPLFQDDLMVVLPEYHPLKDRQKISIQEIAEDPFIMPKAGCDTLVKKLFKEHSISPNVVFEVADNYAILSMVRDGLGISIVPELIVTEDVSHVHTPKLESESYRTVCLAVPSLASAPPAVKAFADIASAKQ